MERSRGAMGGLEQSGEYEATVSGGADFCKRRGLGIE